MKAIKNDNSLTWVQFKELIIRLDESEKDPEKMKDLLNKLAGGGLMAGGAAILLPSAAIAALNAVGFTASGVLAGSLAAGIQSVFYGGMTGGLFSLGQSIAATAVMAPPLAIGLGIGALVVGAGHLAFSSSSDEDDWDYDI
ncbi:hypothetical protein MPER_09889 [Moniliophthora perniciosa FA553]|nr:hypothetical protein MPER_09889 [Moniliophthora perniciosa FA553]